MAFYRQSKLNPLKLTVAQRGRADTRMLFREPEVKAPVNAPRQPEGSIEIETEKIGASACVPTDSSDFVRLPDGPLPEEPTLHELQRKSSVRGWEQL